MAPLKDQIRLTIRARIAERRAFLRWSEPELAEKIGKDKVSIKRWEGTHPDPTTPSLADARKLADALGVSLDWLTGREMTPVDQAASIAAWTDREVEKVRLRLDRLLDDLTAARRALISGDETELDVSGVGAVVGKQAAKKPRKTITVPRDAAG